MRFCHEITALQHCDRPRHMIVENNMLPNPPKEGTSAVLPQSGLDETSGGQILWNAVAICEISRTSWQKICRTRSKGQ